MITGNNRNSSYWESHWKCTGFVLLSIKKSKLIMIFFFFSADSLPPHVIFVFLLDPILLSLHEVVTSC